MEFGHPPAVLPPFFWSRDECSTQSFGNRCVRCIDTALRERRDGALDAAIFTSLEAQGLPTQSHSAPVANESLPA
jgi:hypothetical protein